MKSILNANWFLLALFPGPAQLSAACRAWEQGCVTVVSHVTFTRLVFWEHHGYTSLNASLESSSESDSEGSGDELSAGDPSDREIQYVVGDVTRPQNTGDSDAIVVHCVGT